MNLRLQYGLRWRRAYPGFTELRRWLAGIFAACAFFAVLGIADHVDATTERAIHAERAADVYSAQADALKDCERGAAGYFYADGRAFECGKAL